ncbi:hypothetical protein [Chlorobium phaeobacteroides]|jgi:hypothetical protein|uniref:DUF883 domain-containing protein n=1 Tax=Chlorobium phaeobacteroides (strain DSM 266 / SMG 266 / 2430) TaxID=290317 RepID=A1BDL5_CHLPD|nr:hypothetical protein [Chlorobium phaeobacteroides]ABL64492.1 conserved hypothetical protein [Chlorobium phaeobacteroides DSM 266]MBV5329416.1 hypothetical protein [Chlorobium sp.]
MEQEVPVTIHQGETVEAEAAETMPKPDAAYIPELIKEIASTVSETFSGFRESESYGQLIKAAEEVRTYIKNNPAQALLYSLGAGAALGFLFKKRR